MSRTHLITGAGSGIGRVLAQRLHDRGDRLVLVARSIERGDQLAADLPGAGVVVADLADPVSLADLRQQLPDRLDSVIHVAGVVDLQPIAEVEQESLQRQLDVNLVAPVLLTREALPALRAARGLVLFVNSTAGLTAGADWSSYAASKAGLRAVAGSLAAEESGNGVRVTTVYPSRTATPMQELVHAQEGADYDQGRWIQPETVADTILYVVDLPADATISEITVRPAPRH